MKHIALLLILALSTACWAINGDLGGGTGSKFHPYLIEDLADFDTFADPNNAAAYWASGVHTKLMTDIDLAGRTYTDAVIAPDFGGSTGIFVGTPFSGNFDGNGFAVKNLSMNGTRYCGFFGKMEAGSEVKDLGIENVSITGSLYYVGGLAAYNDGGITNSYSTGTVSGTNAVGGLVGENWGGSITNCHSIGMVTGTDDVGGLVGGQQTSGSITNSYSTGTAEGDRWVGGLAGFSSGSIASSYSTVSVTGSYAIGGLAGEQTEGSIANCYASGAVTGSYAGGLVGTTWASSITKSYSTGAVHGQGVVGGLIGENLIADVTNCFWDIDTSDRTTSAGGTSKTTTEMMTQSTFTAAGWDFSTPVWMMLREGEDYPRLAWQEVFAGDIAGLYGVDMVDFSYLGQYWGLDDCNGLDDCGRADVDTSGAVSLTDLAAVTDHWLKGL